MAEIKTILYESKKLKKGLHPVMIRVTHMRKRKYYATGFKCKPEQWEEEYSQFNTGYKKRKAHNDIILSKVEKAKKINRWFEDNDRPFSFEVFERKFKGINQKVTLFKFFEKHIESLRNANREGYADTMQFTLNSLKNFRKEKDLKLFDVDYNFLSEYDNYLDSRDIKPNSKYVYFRTLRTVINEAIRKGFLSVEFYPFQTTKSEGFDIANFKEDTKKRSLTKTDIIRILNMDLSKRPDLDKARKIFLFSYLGFGVNFTDIARLKWENIRSDRVTYLRQKTKFRIKEKQTFKLLPEAWEIINSFENVDSEYVFPILHEDIHKTERQKLNRIQKVRKQINDSLKTIASELEIKDDITTYWARHSAANILHKEEGTAKDMIQELLGHKDLKTTDTYLKSFEDSEKDKQTEKLL